MEFIILAIIALASGVIGALVGLVAELFLFQQHYLLV